MFVTKFDCRKATILGGLVMSAGIALAAFAYSSMQLFLYLGVVTGIT